MKAGDLVRNKNSESGEKGIFLGMRTFKNRVDAGADYTCAEVYWPERTGKYTVSTIQANLIEVVCEIR